MSNRTSQPLPLIVKPPASRWRFSLGSILMLMTVLSLVLGSIRAVPMSDEIRVGILGLSIVTLLAMAPQWLRYLQLQHAVEEQKAKTQRWLEEFRASHAESDSPPQDGSQGPTSEP